MNQQTLVEDPMISDATLRSPDAFAEMAQRFYGRVYFTALAIVRQADTAEDIAQETFLRAWLKRDAVKQPALVLQPWLVRIATNLALQWLRTGQQRSRLLPLIPMEDVTVEPVDDTKLDPRQAAGSVEQRSQVEEAVMALPTELRHVVLLHYAEGLSVRDIARMNGEAPSTVTRRMEKARAQLRQHLENGFSAGLAMLKPRHGQTQKIFGIITAAAAIPAAARAQLRQMASDTPPPPTADAITSAADAATIEETGVMKSIIAKLGAAKIIAGAAVIAAVGGAVYGVNQITRIEPGRSSVNIAGSRDTKVQALEDNQAHRQFSTSASPKTIAATEEKIDKLTIGKKRSVSDRIALLENDLVSTRPTFVAGDGKTSAGIYLDMLVVDGSGFPVEGATLNLYELKYQEAFASGTSTFPSDTTGTIMISGGYKLMPVISNASGLARIFVPQYTGEHLTSSFSVRAAHPDFTATFAEIELTSVTKIVMTGGQSIEVIPVDAATSTPILAGVTPVVESDFKPDWEQRPDGMIAFRRISGESLHFYLQYTAPNGRKLLSEYKKVNAASAGDEPITVALNPTYQVRGTLSVNVPRPVNNVKVQAQASVPLSSTKLGWQEVEVAHDGSFLLTGLPPGDILISALSEGYNSTRPEDSPPTETLSLPQRLRLTGNNQEYVLPMAARGTLRVKVVDAQQQPVDGATVLCLSQISFNSRNSERWEDDVIVRSDKDGVAVLTGLPADQFNRLFVRGEWQLEGDPVGETGLVNRLKEFQLSSGETRDVTVTVEPSTE